MSVDKPKATQSEKAQVQFANEAFERGSEAQRKISADVRGDYRRSNRGKNTSRINGMAAKNAAKTLAARRKAKVTRVDSASSVNTDIRNLSISAPVQAKRSGVGNTISGVSRTLNSASSSRHGKSMDDFRSSNERTQALMDAGVAIGTHVAYENQKTDYERVSEWMEENN